MKGRQRRQSQRAIEEEEIVRKESPEGRNAIHAKDRGVSTWVQGNMFGSQN